MSDRVQQRLWNMAVVNAHRDMNSDVAALYVESLNEVIDLHATRVAVGRHARIPWGIWLSLGLLVLLGMTSVGYQSAASVSRRSRAMPILAAAFALAITVMVSLDRPKSDLIPVSQQPLEALRDSMAQDARASADREETPGPSGNGGNVGAPLLPRKTNAE
jgi:hypothetical protein